MNEVKKKCAEINKRYTKIGKKHTEILFLSIEE
jgi:hypothetical protein